MDARRVAADIRLAKRLLEIREKALGADNPELAHNLNNLASIHYAQAQYAEAEPLLRRVLAMEEKALGANHPDLASALDDLAEMFQAQGRYAEAEPLGRRALALREKAHGANHSDLAWSLHRLSAVCNAQARYPEAEAFCQRALNLRETTYGLDHPYTIESIGHLTDVYEKLGRYAEAEPLCRRAMASREKAFGLDHILVAESVGKLADIRRAQGQFADAELLHRRALAIREKARGADHPEVAQSLKGLAELCKLQGRREEAERLIERAIKIVEDRAVASSLGLECYRLHAELQWQAQRTDVALADLRRAMDRAEQLRSQSSGAEHERAQSFAQYAGVFETAIAWQSKLGNVAEAFEAAERCRARSLADQLQLHGISLLAGLPEDEAAELRNRDVRARCRVAELQKECREAESRAGLTPQQLAERRKELESQLAKAQLAVVEVYRDIRNSSPAYRLMVGDNFKPVPLKQLQTFVAEQHAALLEYVLGDEGGYVFVLSASHEPRLLPLELSAEDAERVGMKPGPLTTKRMKELMTIDKKPLQALVARPEVAAGALARLAALWRVVVPPDERKTLVDGSTERLMVVPDGPLALLPFETLVVESGQQPKYLLEAGPPILYAPSSTVLHNLTLSKGRLSAAGAAVLTVGNATYDAAAASPPDNTLALATGSTRYRGVGGKLSPLPFTDWEVNWVAENFRKAGLDSMTIKAQDATEANVRAKVVGRRFVHLACHGMAEEDFGNFYGALALTPADSGNPDDDGFLTLSEIYQLNLKSCELAILSACETNVGPELRGEGVWAISRGFLVAGSRRVVASNWLVDDESAASLISYYSGGLAKAVKDGTTPDYARCLHEAKRWVRKQEKWKSPYYWAAFGFVGPQ
jgi:CHAT domain-containing protein/tetratricopeptide (TPR) repeat protein